MDFDEHIDPLDPRFVDAVLARARRRVAEGDEAPPAAAVPPAVPVGEPAAPVAERSTPAAPPADTYAYADADGYRNETFGTGTATAVVAEVDAPLDPLDDDASDDPSDDTEHHERRRTRSLVEWVAVAVGAVVVAFLIRAFLVQAFYIPSESMEPTLHENDRILVNKLSYRLHGVNRGDLVVFEKPPNEPATGINDLIKRSIALSGETIELHPDGTITIDDRVLDEPYLADGQQPGPTTMARERFVDGACTNPISESSRCTLGEGFVFVMGDNRDQSHDGRAFGPIDEDLIVGRAFVKVWPLSNLGFL